MPVRNVLKQDLAESYYHVYSRGTNKQIIFQDEPDFSYFLKLFTRYLSDVQQVGEHGVPYPHLTNKIEVLCYCLMPNHFHLLLYQISPGAMTCLLRSLLTSYSRYFNLKYKRRGPLFESRYKAAHIKEDTHLLHITRYIHLNPRSWRRYPYSSLPAYSGQQHRHWLKPERVLSTFDNKSEYRQYLIDYEANARALAFLKPELADQ